MPYNGITISVTAETNAGGRKHMEDYIAVNLSPNDELLVNPELREQAFVGVFDGHGGKEAAKYAREKMWQMIQKQPKFQTHDRLSVREAINDAYLQLHETMLSSRDSWLPNKTGDLSTAGTTASTVIIRKNHIYVANVGDSTGIMGIRNPDYGQPGEPPVIAKLLTKDHKPEDPEEQENIKKLGGQVALSMKGVMRVVWERERTKSNGKKETDFIPFLSVARSLGDFWSYNSRSGKYTVSPVPYITDFPLDLHEQKFIVLASDGLWNVMTPSDVVRFIYEYDTRREIDGLKKDVVGALIKEALSRWERRMLQADNIAVLIAYLNEEEMQNNFDITKDNTQQQQQQHQERQNGSNENTNLNNLNIVESASSELACPSKEISPPLSPLPASSSSSSLLTSSSCQTNEFSNTSNGTSKYFKKILPNGSTIEFENFTKYRHRRKHKKHKKHSLKHRYSSRASPIINTSESSNSSTCISSSSTCSSSNNISNPPTETETVLIETTPPTNCLAGQHDSSKRKRTPSLEEVEEDDEGVSLSPSDLKKQKLDTTDIISPSIEEDLSTLTSSDDHLLTVGGLIRSQRISTDNRSDSGSSGIISDMDSNSIITPINTTTTTVPETAASTSTCICITEERDFSMEEEEERNANTYSEELMESCNDMTSLLPAVVHKYPVLINSTKEELDNSSRMDCTTITDTTAAGVLEPFI